MIGWCYWVQKEGRKGQTANTVDNAKGKYKEKRKRPRLEAVIITPTTGRSYAEVVRYIRSHVEQDEMEDYIEAIKVFRPGDALLERGR